MFKWNWEAKKSRISDFILDLDLDDIWTREETITENEDFRLKYDRWLLRKSAIL